jgi:cytochrome c-type biogenesis protein CcmH
LQRRWRGGTILLLLALAVAGFVIGKTIVSGNSQATQPSVAGDPLTTLEARVKDQPDDGEAWSALAGVYFESGRFDEAVTAYDAALKLSPQRSALWSARGEARVMASPHDPMPAAAATDFEQAVARDPHDPRARYFLAVKQDLAGDHRGAIDSWLALLGDTPPGAVWEADLRRTIEQAGKVNRIDVGKRLTAVRQPAPLAKAALPAPAMPTVAGPSAEDISRASAMRPSEQREMAEGMVARLEDKLKRNPANADGWMMLIRSRINLGQPDLARAALAAAVSANPGQAAQLREQAAALGLR